jgi:hypothetical protein
LGLAANPHHQSIKEQDHLDILKRAGRKYSFRLNTAAAHTYIDKSTGHDTPVEDKLPVGILQLKALILAAIAVARIHSFPFCGVQSK